MITITNLTKKFGDFTAVDAVNLDITEGKIYGFVGKNGAGKSTTIRTMMNMLYPTDGEIQIGGLDSIKDTKKIKKTTSYMPSDITYYDNLKVMQFLKFILKFTSKSLDDALELARHFELDTSKKIAELSLGNKKKVSIIAMLLKDADVLVLDEPTNGLDPLMQKKFFEIIIQLRDSGVTTFLSSHNLLEIERYCDEVAIIKDGKIVEVFDMAKVDIKHKQTVTYKIKGQEEVSRDITEDINELIQKLAGYDLDYLEIKNKSVEDEFIGYYESEEKSNA